jgi:hypothetical protein
LKNIITDESLIFINNTQERFKKILDKASAIYNYSIGIGKRSSFLIKDNINFNFNNNYNYNNDNNIFNRKNTYNTYNKYNYNYSNDNDNDNEINVNYRRSLFKEEIEREEEDLQHRKPRHGLDNEYYRD